MTAKSGIVSGSNPLCKSLMSENDLLMGVGLRLDTPSIHLGSKDSDRKGPSFCNGDHACGGSLISSLSAEPTFYSSASVSSAFAAISFGVIDNARATLASSH